MQKLILFGFVLSLLTLSSCKDDDPVVDTTPMYHIHIHSPNTDDKHVGDDLTTSIDFEEHDGLTVHHVNVRLYNKATGEELFNLPTEEHVHETDGLYEFTNTTSLNVDAGTTWVLAAKVWGDTDGLGEVQDSIEFNVVQ